MNIIHKKKIIFILLLFSLIISSFSLQRTRLDKGRKREVPTRRREIPSFNSGQIFCSGGRAYADGQVLVKFKPTLRPQAIDAIVAAYDSKTIKKLSRVDVYQLRIPSYSTVEEMVYVWKQNPDVEYAVPNYIARITVTPNDPYFNLQYALHNTGQQIGQSPGSPQGKAGADIKAPPAWEETKGSQDIIIAVLDTGIDFLHPDLKNKTVSTGRDFANDDFDATDDDGHGTFVAGVAAAETDNNEGGAGVAWECKILPIKVTDASGEGEYSWLIEGIIWAADNGADVINLSLGGPYAMGALEEALRYAQSQGVVNVAAAGNDGGSVLYPAAYDGQCLAVAATDYNDIRPDWSNFGPEVDVAAPGERIFGPVPTWYWPKYDPGTIPAPPPYAFGGGTSFSSPHVAGLAALIKALKPWLTVAQVMDVIRFSADDINSFEDKGRDDFIGYGRINMEKALVPIKISK